MHEVQHIFGRNADRAIGRGENSRGPGFQDVIGHALPCRVEFDPGHHIPAVRQVARVGFIHHFSGQKPQPQPVRAGFDVQEGFPVHDHRPRRIGLQPEKIGPAFRVCPLGPSAERRADAGTVARVGML